MTIFWILVAGLAALALLFVVPPLLTRHEAERAPDQDQLNLALFRQQLKELDADLEAGNLDRGQYQAARRDLERELLHDVDGQGAGPTGPGKRAPMTALLLALALPAFATWLYFTIGDRAIIPRLELAAANRANPAAAGHGAAGGADAASLEVLVERLAAKMEQNPDQLEGWLMLGRTYVALEQPAKGAAALQRALALAPQDPEIMVSLAQALAAAAGGQLAGRPVELIVTALAVEPDHATGLWLHGLAAYQAKDFAPAVERWERLAQGLDPNSEDSAQLRQFIADAREEGGLPPGTAPTATRDAPTTGQTASPGPPTPPGAPQGPPAKAPKPAPPPAPPPPASPAPRDAPTPGPTASPGPTSPAGAPMGTTAMAPSTATPPATPPAASPATPPAASPHAATRAPTATTPPASGQASVAAGPKLQVEVSLAEPLWREADVNHSLFVYAKAASGPPMPLAVKRLKVADLPLTVTLDDSLAMTPEMRLSNFPRVIVGARISPSGQATPQSGDLEGETGPLAPADQTSVKVLIERVRP